MIGSEYKIYKLVDPIDESIRYVGLTFNSLKQRLKSHRNEKSKSHKTNWINHLKGLGQSPYIELIETVSDYNEACEREIFWIDKLKKEGHNLTNHASGGNKNKKMSNEVRLKMSFSQKERHKKNRFRHSDETKKLFSIIHKEIMSDPANREKLRVSNTEYENSKSQEQKIKDILIQNPKTVVQFDQQMNVIREFISIKQAAKETNLFAQNISKCCHMKVSTVGGFVWRFKDDKRLTRLDKRKNKCTKIVQQLDENMNLIEEFDSAKVASEKTDLKINNIFKCCSGYMKSSGGFIWRYKKI